MSASPVTRFDALFARLEQRAEIAFVPFLVLGDPDPETSARLLEALADGGADAVELGLPFSDPIADGPTIQAAGQRALEAGVTRRIAFDLVRDFTARHPDIPVGLLTYANLVMGGGREAFYQAAGEAGIDGVLIADVPGRELQPFADAARSAGVAPVLMAPPGASSETLDRIVELGAGFTYCVTRPGVTGAREQFDQALLPPLDELAARGAPPALLGFGISRPEHVVTAAAAGAAGAISGSAVVQHIAQNIHDPAAAVHDVTRFVAEMKEATRPAGRSP